MTKGKRSRQREKRRQAAQEGHNDGVLARAVRAQAEGDQVEKGHSQTTKSEGEADVQMSTIARIFEWIRNNANAVIAIFTIVIAGITGIQACIYSSQLDWLRIDERAWLAVKFTPFNGPIVGQKLPAPIVAMNVGRTVAKNIHGWVFFRPVPIGNPLDLSEYKRVEASSLPEGEPLPAWTKFDTGVIFPNDPIYLPQAAFASTAVGKASPEATTWDQARQDQWLRGDTYLALNGKVTYDDADGRHHWTTFCNIFLAPASGKNVSRDSADRCTAYNIVDDNK
jgi:hypothetical protein